MKTIVGALCLALASGGMAQAAGAADPLMGPIHQFIDSFNKGDVKTAAAANADDVSIIDEVPPHAWHGAGAFQAWASDLDKASKAAGQTDESVALGKVTRSQVDGDTGYVVVEATYLYKQHGKRVAEPAQMVFALHQETSGWKIAAWSWTGGAPHDVIPAKPKPMAPASKPSAPAPKKP
jgi:ketosteroid isomerase-like protein